MRRSYAGGARASQLTGTIAPTDALIPVGTLNGWPDPADGPFSAVINRGGDSEEKILCSDNTGGFLTVLIRGYDGTAAVDHVANETVQHIATATDEDEANEHVNSNIDVHGLSGGDRLVGEDRPATLKSKTMSGLDNTFTDLPASASPEIQATLVDLAAVDVVLQGNIDAEALARAGAVSDESIARADADVALEADLAAESTARANADAAKANQDTTYTKTEVDTALALKVDDADLAFQSYTPVLSWTLGNGTVAGEYQQIGKLVNAWVKVTVGSTTSAPAGNLTITLPVTAAAATFNAVGSGYLRDNSAGAYRACQVILGSTTVVNLLTNDRAGVGTLPDFVDGTVPWGWAGADTLVFSATYRAA